MSQNDQWNIIPEDLFNRIFVEEIQQDYSGFAYFIKLTGICRKWRFLAIKMLSYPNISIDLSNSVGFHQYVHLLTDVKILNLSNSYICDDDLKYFTNATRLILANNLAITSRGLSYLQNAEYIQTGGTSIIIDNETFNKLPKLKVLAMPKGIDILQIKIWINIPQIKILSIPFTNWKT